MDAKNIESIYPLAPQQQGIFLESRASVGSGIHVEQAIQTLTDSFDVGALEEAWQQVIARHPMLRTAFVWQGQDRPLQAVLCTVAASIHQEDWRLLTAEAQRERLELFLSADRTLGFELNRPPLIRLALFRTGEESFEFVRTFHHILIDGWSIPIINRDLAHCYAAAHAGRTAPLMPTTPYRDYVAWLNKQDRGEAESYWRRLLTGWRCPTPIGRLSEATARTDEPQCYRYAEAEISPATTASLQRLARRSRVTLNTVLQGAWALLLSRCSGDRDVVFGTTVSGRPTDLPGIETTIGLFVNTLPFRVTVALDSLLAPWLETVQSSHLQMRRYEYCSTGQIHQWIEMPASAPLFESALVYENYPEAEPIDASQGLIVKDVRQTRLIGAQTRFAVTMLAITNEGLLLRLVYDSRRFDSGADPIVEQFAHLLTVIAANPDQPLHSLLDSVDETAIPKFRLFGHVASEAEPRTPTEAILADIGAEVLGLPRIGIHDNLLQLGAHSLVAAQFAARIRTKLRCEITISAVFETPTVAGLASLIQSNQTSDGPTIFEALRPIDRDRNLPVSFAQQRLWLLDQLDPGLAVYNASARIRLLGPLDSGVLERSLTEIVARHESLRTVFKAIDEEPVQVVIAPTQVPVPLVDLCNLDAERQHELVDRFAREEADAPFDLAADLMIRARVLRVGDAEHILLLTLHHIASDAWSMNVLYGELQALYGAYTAAQPSPLPALKIQYADYAAWERTTLNKLLYSRQLAYWRTQLSGAPAEPVLKTDRLRSEQPDHRGACHTVTLALADMERLHSLASQTGSSLYIVLVAAFHALLRFRSGQDTVMTGANVANRPHVALEPLIGFFVNQIVLRSDMTGNPTFTELLSRVREVALQGFGHQEVPFDMVVANQRVKRTLNATPLYQVLFVQNIPIEPVEVSGLKMLAPEFDTGYAKFDIAVFCEACTDGIRFAWIYKSALFYSATVSRMAELFIALLNAVAADPAMRLDQVDAHLVQVELRQEQELQQERASTSRRMFGATVPKTVTLDPTNQF